MRPLCLALFNLPLAARTRKGTTLSLTRGVVFAETGGGGPGERRRSGIYWISGLPSSTHSPRRANLVDFCGHDGPTGPVRWSNGLVHGSLEPGFFNDIYRGGRLAWLDISVRPGLREHRRFTPRVKPAQVLGITLRDLQQAA